MSGTSKRRAVVTGLGLVTPVGVGVEANWESLIAGKSGIGPITHFDTTGLTTHIAGEVKGFNPEDFIERKIVKQMDPFIQFSVAAAQMAMDSSGLVIDDDLAPRTGVIIGVGICGLGSLEAAHSSWLETGLKRFSPFNLPKLLSNLAPGQIAMRFGAKGINYSTTSACSSGGHAVGEAFRLIQHGGQDVVICGGAEAAVTPLGMSSFCSMRALSTRNDDPQRASRPFDKNRDGFVMGEGAGVLILEERERALARGAKILAEVIGYGANCDAYHITKPAPEGRGAADCMRLCLDDAGLSPDDVGYINAHGTSTEFNDLNESLAIRTVFGSHADSLAVSSTKSMTGHLLGGSGGIEAAYTVMAIDREVLPPTMNQEEADPNCDLDYVPNEARAARVDVALSNSYGFGGTNVVLAFRRPQE